MDRTTLYRLLNNRMYIGEALFNGEWHSGIYPPIIDLDLWRAVQDKLAQRARRKGAPNAGRQLHEFPFLGRLFWHDGRAYTAFKSSPRGKKHYTYYVAPATEEEKASQQPPFNIATDALHQALIEHLRSLFRNPQAWLLELLDRTPLRPHDGRDPDTLSAAKFGPRVGLVQRTHGGGVPRPVGAACRPAARRGAH